MSDRLHTVTIAGDRESPRIEFVCHGDRDTECHSYPDCQCESWIRGDHKHPFVPHDDCWMKSWFDNADDGGTDPNPETLIDCDIQIGASGPISYSFNGDCVEWDFSEVTP